MKVRSMRAAGALVAALLVAPLGVGAAGATTPEPEETSAVVSDEAAAPEAGASEGAEDTATDGAGEDGADESPAAGSEGADAEDGTEGEPTEDPTGSADADEAVVPAPIERTEAPVIAPVDGTLEIDAIEVTASSETQLPWNSGGVYTITVLVEDVVGLVGGTAAYSWADGNMDDPVFEYQVNGGGWTTVAPAADGSFPVSGLVEGDNTVEVRATYTTPSMVVVGDQLIQDVKVLSQTETAAIGLTLANEVTVNAGESFVLYAPAGFFGANETVNVYVYQDGASVLSMVLHAAADGSLEEMFTVPSNWVGDYLFQAQGTAGYESGWLLVHVPATPVPAPADPPTPTLSNTPTTVATTTAPLTPNLAATGADPTVGIIAAVVAVLLGAGTVFGVRRFRGRETGELAA